MTPEVNWLPALEDSVANETPPRTEDPTFTAIVSVSEIPSAVDAWDCGCGISPISICRASVSVEVTAEGSSHSRALFPDGPITPEIVTRLEGLAATIDVVSSWEGRCESRERERVHI